MSYSRIIRWPDAAPSRQELEREIREFIGEGGGAVGAVGAVGWHDDTGRWYIDLPGKPSRSSLDWRPTDLMHPSRWIEVWAGVNVVDVITRHADPYTSALADRLVREIAEHFHGQMEMP